ncbi:23S rRNA (pseudouridine(1915)-N(3))-methyltransferase RlmH [Ruminiclostridium cellobioparum]|uniref:Ribosomal RNA large subunit methyltransferase H n=1 Tax=Ruminiclostridium cellobioparum subsp. termitidis CT1112 TaxID=1195236 RepID=S0FG97_RUMCE|nr:23S rRNA (pseudouridine(1915)-N(3))-methyltransferase RlmH [Ruminiclostridium cellobioparum]EMS70335.1 rRNA large subunit m3Psi methyltransferase RlmH [Ruminiclostridium cellobioparum subsp. termitidis CT1112]
MKITIAAVGKLKERYLKEGISEYTKRLSRFADMELIEVEDEHAPDTLSPAQEAQVKQREAERLLKRVKEGSYIILLDLAGEQTTSEGLASKLESVMLTGNSHITFIIGGSLGLDQSLVSAASYRICLSKMTFPHQLARLILLEQTYRAFKIMKNETYHK